MEKVPVEQTNKIRGDLERMELELGTQSRGGEFNKELERERRPRQPPSERTDRGIDKEYGPGLGLRLAARFAEVKSMRRDLIILASDLNRCERHAEKSYRHWDLIRNWIRAHPGSAGAVFCRRRVQPPLGTAADLARKILSGPVSASADGRDET